MAPTPPLRSLLLIRVDDAYCITEDLILSGGLSILFPATLPPTEHDDVIFEYHIQNLILQVTLCSWCATVRYLNSHGHNNFTLHNTYFSICSLLLWLIESVRHVLESGLTFRIKEALKA